MADCGGNRGGESSGLVTGLVLGTMLGAAGLGFWLLRQADNRRRFSPGGVRHRLAADFETGEEAIGRSEPLEGELHDKVQRLNVAIEDVRRQLETLGTDGTVHR